MAPCARPRTSCACPALPPRCICPLRGWIRPAESGLDRIDRARGRAALVRAAAPDRLGAADGDRVGFDLELGRPAGDVEMRVRGQHDLASATGHAELDLPPVRFAPDRLQPTALAPVLAGVVEDVSGRLALRGALGWGAGAGCAPISTCWSRTWRSASGPARFAQVNGVIAFDRLAPLSTPPGQQLAIGLVDIGLPLTDGLLTFDLEPGQLVVEQLRWQFAEGPHPRGAIHDRFSGHALCYHPDRRAPEPGRDLRARTARRPERRRNDAWHPTDHHCRRRGGHRARRAGVRRPRLGALPTRKQPPAALEAGGENVNLLLQALENFRYEELRLTIDGRTDGEMDVGLHIAGANPDLYDGYPIEFNLNLEGALANVLRQARASTGYQIPPSAFASRCRALAASALPRSGARCCWRSPRARTRCRSRRPRTRS